MQQGNKTTAPEIDFGEFAPATYAEWREAAVAALKGADFDKKLFTKLVEGITLHPIYNKWDEHSPVMPAGQFPYRRGTRALGYMEKPCEIAQSIPASSPEDFNAKLLHDLDRGLTAVNVQLNCKCGLKLRKQADWDAALRGVRLDGLPVYVTPGSCGLGTLSMFLNTCKAAGVKTADLKGGVLYDPVGKAVMKGSLCGGKGICAYYDQMAVMTKWAVANAPGFQTIGVSGLPYADSGASAFEEVGAMLSTAVAYLRAMEERGLSVDETAAHMRFTVSIGANLFLEIAKIRALRELWAIIVKECGGSEEAAKIKLHARTSFWTLSKVDPWVNLLRGSAQAFSAIMGGVDSIDVLPFDAAVRMPDEFSRRIARNCPLILLGECNMDKVVDPAGGSWYLENLPEDMGILPGLRKGRRHRQGPQSRQHPEEGERHRRQALRAGGPAPAVHRGRQPVCQPGGEKAGSSGRLLLFRPQGPRLLQECGYSAPGRGNERGLRQQGRRRRLFHLPHQQGPGGRR